MAELEINHYPLLTGVKEGNDASPDIIILFTKKVRKVLESIFENRHIRSRRRDDVVDGAKQDVRIIFTGGN